MTDPSPPSITLVPAESGHLDRVEALLDANGLPSEDVRTKPECFFVAVDDATAEDATIVGVGGVERYGSNGLLRSVVVAESHRGRGYGAALCDALEDYARTNGIETLYLLTTTASAFFRRHGYEEASRETVPARIRRTTQFAELCPASAACLQKSLR